MLKTIKINARKHVKGDNTSERKKRGAHETERTETSAVFHSSQAEKLTNFTEAH